MTLIGRSGKSQGDRLSTPRKGPCPRMPTHTRVPYHAVRPSHETASDIPGVSSKENSPKTDARLAGSTSEEEVRSRLTSGSCTARVHPARERLRFATSPPGVRDGAPACTTIHRLHSERKPRSGMSCPRGNGTVLEQADTGSSELNEIASGR